MKSNFFKYFLTCFLISYHHNISCKKEFFIDSNLKTNGIGSENDPFNMIKSAIEMINLKNKEIFQITLLPSKIPYEIEGNWLINNNISLT